jgi:hypothetical protein
LIHSWSSHRLVELSRTISALTPGVQVAYDQDRGMLIESPPCRVQQRIVHASLHARRRHQCGNHVDE